MRILKSGVAVFGILTILVGPPLLLIRFFGNPYTDDGLSLEAQLSYRATINLLAVLTWILCAQPTVCLIAQTISILTDKPVSQRLPVFAFQRDLARALLAALLLTTVSAPLWSTAIAHA